MSTTILLVDDSPMERLLAEQLLVKNPDYRFELAETGEQALECLATMPVDLVLTDLIMPEMSGLDLVRVIRQRYPEVPTILMTAYGDESIALEALEAGATSYVPKARRAERLAEIVERVLEHAAAACTRAQLGRCMTEYHCRFSLPNNQDIIRSLVNEVQYVMAGYGLEDMTERIRIGEALEEALLNAMYHGNLEVNETDLAAAYEELDGRLLRRLVEERCREPHIRDRQITVVVHLSNTEVRFVIRDEGRGFSTRLVTAAHETRRFERGRNRGLNLIHALMDEVSYNAAGNELTMRRSVRVPVPNTT